LGTENKREERKTITKQEKKAHKGRTKSNEGEMDEHSIKEERQTGARELIKIRKTGEISGQKIKEKV
jgi:hypothetical protein